MTVDELAQVEAAAYRGALRAIQEGLFPAGSSPLASPITLQQESARRVAEANRKCEAAKVRRAARDAAKLSTKG